MARIGGVNLPAQKRAVVGLTYIYGIGRKTSEDILKALDITQDRRINQLTDDEILRIREFLDANHMIEGDLRREMTMNIKRLTDLGCYKGLRHRKRLPVRGQRTHTNARTRRGKAVAIAGKKK